MTKLRQKLQSLPNSAGVYQFFDTNGKLLYVGKAKVLKNRVKSYFRFTPEFRANEDLGPRIYKMISEAVFLDYIVVDSEDDALILENSLIKQLKPKYNILLRDDKTYPYIYVDFNDEFPRIEITRKVVQGKNVFYFGPFPSGARDIVDTIYENFQLVQKKNCLKGKKACLFYQMKKCLAPCEGKITQKAYGQILDDAIESIKKPQRLLKMLEQKMFKLSQEERYEEAIVARDRLQKLQTVSVNSDIDVAKLVNYDVFAVSADENKGVVVKLFVREGKIVSSSYNYFKHTRNFDSNEVYRQALIEYYTHDIPVIESQILIADSIDTEGLDSFFEKRFHKKMQLLHPKIGAKKKIIDVAKKNALELLKNKPQSSDESTVCALKELLGLQDVPYRFECFDNSHMAGDATVGAMICYDENGFNKSAYKRYKLVAKDEYGQMQEMLERRISSFDKESPPDLWVLDGGDTLVKLANTLLEKAGVNLDVVGIAKEKIDAKAHRAKGSAKDIIYLQTQSFRLSPTDKRLQFLQKLRDEAHRFAITFHKQTKLKKDKQISLLEVQGIGPAKAKRLIDYFGSFEKIQHASIEELSAVLSQNDAKNLHTFYKIGKI